MVNSRSGVGSHELIKWSTGDDGQILVIQQDSSYELENSEAQQTLDKRFKARVAANGHGRAMSNAESKQTIEATRDPFRSHFNVPEGGFKSQQDNAVD